MLTRPKRQATRQAWRGSNRHGPMPRALTDSHPPSPLSDARFTGGGGRALHRGAALDADRFSALRGVVTDREPAARVPMLRCSASMRRARHAFLWKQHLMDRRIGVTEVELHVRPVSRSAAGWVGIEYQVSGVYRDDIQTVYVSPLTSAVKPAPEFRQGAWSWLLVAPRDPDCGAGAVRPQRDPALSLRSPGSRCAR